MISNEEAKKIVQKLEVSDVEALEVISAFIFQKKRVSVSINRPRTQHHVLLMGHVYEIASEYFINV